MVFDVMMRMLMFLHVVFSRWWSESLCFTWLLTMIIRILMFSHGCWRLWSKSKCFYMVFDDDDQNLYVFYTMFDDDDQNLIYLFRITARHKVQSISLRCSKYKVRFGEHFETHSEIHLHHFWIYSCELETHGCWERKS